MIFQTKVIRVSKPGIHYPNWQMPMQPMHYPTQSYGTEAAWSSSADEQQGPWNYIPMDYGAYPEPVNYSRSENYQWEACRTSKRGL